jgi:predicted MFS family arabinose efflux permease
VTAAAARPVAAAHAAIPALLCANAVAGAGTFLPAALLAPMAADLGAGVAATGQSLTAFAAAMAVSAPLLAAATARLDRRLLLTGVLALFALLSLGTAWVGSLAALLVVRTLAGSVAGLITPQVAATAGLLVPAERRASAVAQVFNGYALSIVFGLSVGAYLGDRFGWRSAMVGVAVLAAVVAAWLARVLPRGLQVAPLTLSAARGLFADRGTMGILAVTVLQATGQFMVYSFLGPLLEQQAGVAPRHAGLAFAVLAATGVAGGVWATRALATSSPGRVAGASLAALGAGFAMWPLIPWTNGAPWALAAVAIAWGTPCFAVNMAQQARLIQARPALATLSVAMNSSGMFVGQALGTAVAGALIHADAVPLLSWVGTVLIGSAWLLSAAVERHGTH